MTTFASLPTLFIARQNGLAPHRTREKATEILQQWYSTPRSNNGLLTYMSFLMVGVCRVDKPNVIREPGETVQNFSERLTTFGLALLHHHLRRKHSLERCVYDHECISMNVHYLFASLSMFVCDCVSESSCVGLCLCECLRALLGESVPRRVCLCLVVCVYALLCVYEPGCVGLCCLCVCLRPLGRVCVVLCCVYA